MPSILYNPSTPPREKSIEFLQRYSLEEYRRIAELINGWGKRENYSTTWTGSVTNPTLGNGTLTARYALCAGMVFVAIRLSPGTTTTFGSGTWEFTLPFPIATEGLDIGTWQGIGIATDISVPLIYSGACHFNTNGNTSKLNSYFHGTGGPTTNLVPFTWASGDQLILNCHYPIA